MRINEYRNEKNLVSKHPCIDGTSREDDGGGKETGKGTTILVASIRGRS